MNLRFGHFYTWQDLRVNEEEEMITDSTLYVIAPAFSL